MELPNHSLRKRANVGFVFRTTEPECLLILAVVPPAELANNYFDEKDLLSNYSFSLTNGHLNFWADTGRGRIELLSNNTLNDGEYHTVNVIKTNRRFELRIDDEYQMGKSLSMQPFVINMVEDAGGLYIGGIPTGSDYGNIAPTQRSFYGTIKDIVINNKTITFADVLNFSNVHIGRDGPNFGNHNLYSDLLMKTEPIGKSFTVPPEGCHRVS